MGTSVNLQYNFMRRLFFRLRLFLIKKSEFKFWFINQNFLRCLFCVSVLNIPIYLDKIIKNSFTVYFFILNAECYFLFWMLNINKQVIVQNSAFRVQQSKFKVQHFKKNGALVVKRIIEKRPPIQNWSVRNAVP